METKKSGSGQGEKPSREQSPKLLAYLREQQKDGFWPYLEGRDFALEVSAWAAVALRHDERCLDAYLKRLLSEQNSDGGWSNEAQRLGSDWTTAAALMSLNLLTGKADISGLGVSRKALDAACRRAENWLLENRSEYYSAAAKFALLLWKGPESDYARGWSWTEKTFDWVEPTSYAIMALRSLDGDSKQRERVIELAQEYLLSLACVDGGWNFGDRNPYSAETPPDVQSTALALMALRDKRQDPLIRKSLAWLEQESNKRESTSALVWSMAGLALCGKEVSGLRARVLSSQEPDGRLNSQSLLVQAVAAVFLDSGQGVDGFI